MQFVIEMLTVVVGLKVLKSTFGEKKLWHKKGLWSGNVDFCSAFFKLFNFFSHPGIIEIPEKHGFWVI